jgi:hypothetical protein
MKISSITLLAIATFIFASCQKLLANADPNAKNNQSVIDTQLVSAIKDRDVNAIRAALKDGANPNQVINERQHTVIGLWLIYCYRDRSENAETQCLKVLHMLFGAGAKFQP